MIPASEWVDILSIEDYLLYDIEGERELADGRYIKR